MNTSLYECTIFHKRLKPVVRQFSYQVFMLSVDLDELDQLHQGHWLFSRNKWNIYTIRDDDYLHEKPHHNIKQKLINYLSEQGVTIPDDHRVILQTFPRIFGYQFNPVSFYYIEDKNGVPFLTVAEVGNTYHEKKLFILQKKDSSDWFKRKVAKNFYVSPFSKVTDQFDFQIGPKNKNWSININDSDDEGLVLVSTIRGTRKAFSSLRLAWYTIRYPLLTLRVIFLIHWHALLMWLKKLPISGKKQSASHQKEVLRPHQSLKK